MKKMTLLVIGIVIVAICVIVAVSKKGSVDKLRQTVRIGAILPLTGVAAHIGEWQKNGIKMAVEKANSELVPRYELQLFIEDSKGSPKDALAAYNKLVHIDKVNVVFSSLSSVSNPIVPLANEGKCPLMMICVSYPGIAGRSPWAFRDHPGSEDEALSMLSFLGTRNEIRKIAVFFINDDFGRGGSKIFEKHCNQIDKIIVYSDSYEKDKSDFRSEVAKALSTNPDVFYVIGYVDASAILIKQIREMGFTGMIACNMAMSVPKYLTMVGKGFENSFFTITKFNPDSPTQAATEFVHNYLKQTGSQPNPFAAMAYDGIGMVAKAISTNGPSRAGIRQGLSQLSRYEGVMGSLDINKAGNVVFPLHIAAYKKGKLLIIK